jgi:hypothetical protein
MTLCPFHAEAHITTDSTGLAHGVASESEDSAFAAPALGPLAVRRPEGCYIPSRNRRRVTRGVRYLSFESDGA